MSIDKLRRFHRQLQAINSGNIPIANALADRTEIAVITQNAVKAQIDSEGAHAGKRYKLLKQSTIAAKKRKQQTLRELVASGKMREGLLRKGAVSVQAVAPNRVVIAFSGPEAALARLHQYGTTRGLPTGEEARKVLSFNQEDKDLIGEVVLDTFDQILKGVK